MAAQVHEDIATGRTFESRDVSPRAITYAGIMLFACVGLSIVLVVGLLLFLRHEKEEPFVTSLETSHMVPPAPRLEGYFPSDRASLEMVARQTLQGYAWRDKNTGAARIPIDRAMQILSQHGWPDASKAENP